MAWKLRQFFEGDTVVTMSGITSAGTECWMSGGNYATNTIAINVDGTQHLVPSANADLGSGFLKVTLPTGVLIGAASSVQIYAVCEDLPASKSNTLVAKPINFQIFNDPVKACNPTVIINSDIDEYVRLFFTANSGAYYNLKFNGANMSMSDFGYQSGDTGNIIASSGNFSRPSTDTSSASLISNGIYAGSPNTVTVTPANTTQYYTVRLGYIELIFNSGDLFYINYMVNNEVDVAAGNYTTGDAITIESTNNQYVIRKNGTVVFTKLKNITYTVSSGSVSPSTSQIGVPVVWNLPTTPGTYTFNVTVGNSIKFSKSVILHSCADAIDDTFNATYNSPFTGNVSNNDIKCTGENNYYELAGVSPYVDSGTVTLNQSTGAFTHTPVANFNSTATFYYNIRCGSTFEDSEIVDTAKVQVSYFNACNGVVANWQPNGQTRCTNCTEERQEVDLNATCTGNAPRWVTNPGGSACNKTPNLTPTGLVRCQSCVEQREVQDLNPCSATYQAKSWVTNPTGTQCNTTAVWLDNGQVRCNNCAEEKQQLDTGNCSPTKDQTRWVANPGGNQCNRAANWQPTNEFVCIDCQEFKKEKDLNVCSPSYNVVRNVINEGGTACNVEDNWQDTGVTRCFNGVHEKEQANTNPCAEIQSRWVATGLQLCGCVRYMNFTNLCAPGNNIVGVTVRKQGVSESNRLINLTNNTITYQADAGTFTYIIEIIFQNGVPAKIIDTYKCQPLI